MTVKSSDNSLHTEFVHLAVKIILLWKAFRVAFKENFPPVSSKFQICTNQLYSYLSELAVLRKLCYCVVIGKPVDYYFLTKADFKHLRGPSIQTPCELLFSPAGKIVTSRRETCLPLVLKSFFFKPQHEKSVF
jgi:hypothetical protein